MTHLCKVTVSDIYELCAGLLNKPHSSAFSVGDSGVLSPALVVQVEVVKFHEVGDKRLTDRALFSPTRRPGFCLGEPNEDIIVCGPYDRDGSCNTDCSK